MKRETGYVKRKQNQFKAFEPLTCLPRAKRRGRNAALRRGGYAPTGQECEEERSKSIEQPKISIWFYYAVQRTSWMYKVEFQIDMATCCFLVYIF